MGILTGISAAGVIRTTIVAGYLIIASLGASADGMW